MAMKTLVKNCPFCKKTVEQRSYMTRGREPKDEDRWLFGSPMRLCPHCGKVYIDKDMQELAITGPRKQDTAFIGQSSLHLAAVGAILGTALLLGKQTVLALIAYGVALATLIADAALYPTRKRKLDNERLASEKRLGDPDYARALRRAGYDIPDKYITGTPKEEAK